MPARWTTWNNEQLIAEGVLEIGDGYRAKNSEMGSIGLPFARAGNIDNGFHLENADILHEISVRKAGDKLSRPGDIVFTSKGTVGRFAFVKPATPRFVYSPQLCYWRIKKSSILDPHFLFYWMHGTDFYTQVHQVKSKTTMADYVSLGDQRKMRITAPPLPIQRQIADILSAYDDLIENNTRRIAILEELARSLYHEWFVQFRFPGHERVKLVESEMGMVPEGWEIVPVSAAVHINPLTHVPKDGEKPFVSMTGLSTDSMLIDDIEYREGNSGSKFKNGDTLFARITPCIENGKIGYVQFLPSAHAVAFGSTEFIVLRSKTLVPEYVYLLARTHALRDHAIKSMSGSTGRQRVQLACFDTFFIAQPPASVLSQFERLLFPLFRTIHVLAQRNANLRRTRDLLLPKLITGELDVSGWVEGAMKGAAMERVAAPARTTTAPTRTAAFWQERAAEPAAKNALQWRSLWE
jgi:type I restriction enzyme S subunit